MSNAFDSAWNVVKEEHKKKNIGHRNDQRRPNLPTMKDIMDAAEDRERLVQLIQNLDNRGAGMSGERMAVDLLLNQRVPPEEVRRRMMMLSDNRGDERGVFIDPEFGGREMNMNYFIHDPPYFG